eukprot:GHVL01042711.1.p1 GENE.GHVL01042711.1~~GHVL01042711.1.p1  ORF type:complete len:421 (+),score=53.07 GHVL01042711.1:188-1264(+)
MTHYELIQKKAADSLSNIGPVVDNSLDLKQAEKLGDKLIAAGFITRAQYKPISSTDKPDPSKRPKWPKRLCLTQNQAFDETAFYIVRWEGNKAWSHIVLSMIVLGLFAACMYPAWPFWAKIGVFYIMVAMSTAMLALIFIRLVCFMLLWFLGYDFWIFPRLFEDEASIIESFIPAISFVKRGDGWAMFAVRIATCILIGVAIYQLNQVHSVEDMRNFAKTSFIELVEWGHNYFAKLPEPKNKRPTLEQIESQFREHDDQPQQESPIEANSDHVSSGGEDSIVDLVDDWKCLANCGYMDEADFHKDCVFQCKCLEGIMVGSCFEDCSTEIRHYLQEAKQDACEEEAQRAASKKTKRKEM